MKLKYHIYYLSDNSSMFIFDNSNARILSLSSSGKSVEGFNNLHTKLNIENYFKNKGLLKQRRKFALYFYMSTFNTAIQKHKISAVVFEQAQFRAYID